jgi:hypothetical protein
MMMHEIPIHGMIQRNETTFGTEEYVSDFRIVRRKEAAVGTHRRSS